MTSGEKEWWWERLPEEYDYYVAESGLGTALYTLDRFEDDRGYLSILAPHDIDPPVVYSYFSMTNQDAARDINTWHVHKNQIDRFIVLIGDAMFGISDGKTTMRIVVPMNPTYMLVVPPGVYHCFRPYCKLNVGLLNFPTLPYDPEDEGRVKFVDLDVEHPW